MQSLENFANVFFLKELMLNTFATTILKIVHSYSLPPHTCDAVSNKIAWLRIFLALPSYNSATSLKILVYLKDMISPLQPIGMSATYVWRLFGGFDKQQFHKRIGKQVSTHFTLSLWVSKFVNNRQLFGIIMDNLLNSYSWSVVNVTRAMPSPCVKF